MNMVLPATYIGSDYLEMMTLHLIIKRVQKYTYKRVTFDLKRLQLLYVYMLCLYVVYIRHILIRIIREPYNGQTFI